jgi:hypothetical protein
LTILNTGWKSTRDAYDGPFRSQRPTIDNPEPGTLLNYEPWWWPNCGIGGWAKAVSWWRPDAAALATIYGIMSGEAGASMPDPGVPHTLILYMKFWRYEQRPVSGGHLTGPTNGSGFRGDTVDADSNAVLRAVHLTCPVLSA